MPIIKSCFIIFKSKVNIWEVIGITIKSRIISVNEGLEVFKTYFHNRTDKQESKYCIDTDKAFKPTNVHSLSSILGEAYFSNQL